MQLEFFSSLYPASLFYALAYVVGRHVVGIITPVAGHIQLQVYMYTLASLVTGVAHDVTLIVRAARWAGIALASVLDLLFPEATFCSEASSK